MSDLKKVLDGKTNLDTTEQAGIDALAGLIHFMDMASVDDMKLLRDELKAFGADFSTSTHKRHIAKKFLPLVNKQIKEFG